MIFIPPAILIVSIAYSLLCMYSGRFISLDLFTKELPQLEPKLVPPNPTTPQPPSRSLLYEYKNAAICSDSIVCSTIGRQILQKNGTAVDAAISTLLCNGLITMQSMGLGGGMLMNIYSKREKRAYSVLSREVAPLVIKAEYFSKFKTSAELAQSSLSIAVPTEIMGYAVAHERFGNLDWSELVQPTVEICESGYMLTKHQRDSLETNWIMLSKNTLLRQMFWNPASDQLYRMGTIVKPPMELCRTYKALERHGPRFFYDGELALNISKDLRDMGSLVSIDDLQSLKVEIKESIAKPLGEFFIHFMPPPSSGYILGLIMQILNRFYVLSKHSKEKEMNALDIHRIVEALKFAFVRRWELDVNATEDYLANLACPKFASEISAMIDDNKTYKDPIHYGAGPNLFNRSDHGTAHISVLAPNGDAVSVTSSINFYFGSGRTGLRTGVLFNNAISDFSIGDLSNYFELPNLKHVNQPLPSHSPMSSMTPIILTDDQGDVSLVIGAAGGSKIISALAHILVRIIWMGENVKEAIDAARFHHQLLPNILEYEYGIQQQIIDELMEKGHETKRYRERGSAVCGIQRNKKKGIILANADYRKDGGVVGF